MATCPGFCCAARVGRRRASIKIRACFNGQRLPCGAWLDHNRSRNGGGGAARRTNPGSSQVHHHPPSLNPGHTLPHCRTTACPRMAAAPQISCRRAYHGRTWTAAAHDAVIPHCSIQPRLSPSALRARVRTLVPPAATPPVPAGPSAVPILELRQGLFVGRLQPLRGLDSTCGPGLAGPLDRAGMVPGQHVGVKCASPHPRACGQGKPDLCLGPPGGWQAKS
jgi:hypothetical protein